MFAFANVTVGKRLVAGFGLAAVTLLLIALVSYRNANLLIETEHWVGHTHQVRAELAELLSQLKDAETGQRGYVITGEESYLDPYKSGVTGSKTTLADLKNLTGDNPSQQRRFAAVTPLIDGKLAELGNTVDPAPNPGFRCRTQGRRDECRQDVHGSDSHDSHRGRSGGAIAACRSGPRRRAPAPTRRWRSFSGAVCSASSSSAPSAG